MVRAAARNNAEWCAAMSRSHGVEGEFTAGAWAAAGRTPLYYPDAVTLEPGVDAGAVVARIDAAPGASVKDSFADLDLSGAGFGVLFEARWIHRAAEVPVRPSGLSWEVAVDAGALRDWAAAWGDDTGLFRAELLREPETFVLSGLAGDGRVVAGAVASRSERVVGISNVFAREGESEAGVAWAVVLEAVESLFPALPVVGYEHGDALAAAVEQGFEELGALRVWVR
ncbi:hypothetical protein K4B79_25420 [Streptomyces lincolnensis]|nr:hypothetical protein [Streptomyces lincolnensis]